MCVFSPLQTSLSNVFPQQLRKPVIPAYLTQQTDPSVSETKEPLAQGADQLDWKPAAKPRPRAVR